MNAVSLAFDGYPDSVRVRQATAPMEVTIVLLEEGLSSTAVMPMEIFRCAGALWPALQGTPAESPFRVTTASLNGNPVSSSYGPDLTPCMAINDVGHSDIVIVPTCSPQWSERLAQNSALPPWLEAQYAEGAYVAGACMGAAYLAEAGLLDQRKGTTHWAVAEQFQARYPQVDWQPQLAITEDARTLCSAGVSAAIDVSFYLVEKLCGHELAAQCAKALMLPLPSADQWGYAMLPLSPPHGDDRVRVAEMFIRNHYMKGISTAALSEVAGLETRTFARRFRSATGCSPVRYVQAVRINAAKAKLERGNMNVQEVSCAVGYEDAPFFRRLFRRVTGMTPVEYRFRFGRLCVRRAPQTKVL